ncbi:hypothetical protein B566_EDAN012784 [Ephemera danica]|nr:hypothetical protein B566_EDAN012784 [Ephemera danica]
MAGASLLSRPADEFGNDPSVEAMWAIKAMDHAEVYFNILCSVDPVLLRLTHSDDEVYQAFREEFPDLKVDSISEDELKSANAKEVVQDTNHFQSITKKSDKIFMFHHKGTN